MGGATALPLMSFPRLDRFSSWICPSIRSILSANCLIVLNFGFSVPEVLERLNSLHSHWIWNFDRSGRISIQLNQIEMIKSAIFFQLWFHSLDWYILKLDLWLCLWVWLESADWLSNFRLGKLLDGFEVFRFVSNLSIDIFGIVNMNSK